LIGWIKTFEEYYATETRQILTNMVEKLSVDPRRKFIWAEVSFFAMWWSEQPLEVQQKVKTIIKNGQLEIVTGGWVMNDEANSFYYAILEQLILGHEWLRLNLEYKPK
jgi:alpha-mannosidase II